MDNEMIIGETSIKETDFVVLMNVVVKRKQESRGQSNVEK